MNLLDNYCRLCLSKDRVVSTLFDDDIEDCEFPLYKKVMRCASVKIRWGDGLPTQVCEQCLDRVNSMWRFREQCEHIDVSLRKFVKQNKKKLNDNWEEEIRSIIKDAQSGEARPRRLKKPVSQTRASSPPPNEPSLPESPPNRKPSPLPSAIKEEESCEPEDSVTHTVVKVETLSQDEDEWPQSPSSPTSPPSPPSPPSAESPPVKNNKDEEGVSPSGRKKRKKYDRRRTEYSCEFCGRTFPRSNHLAQHELTHTAEKPFQCSECKKSFWYKASLIGHIKQTHTGDVNYTCELCGKGFFKKTELTRHKPTHSNETPHKCPQCGMGFKITKTLKRHIRNVHTAQRSHTCHTCGKSFTQLQTLKVHLVLHSGVKPYVCSYCGKGFSQSAPLKTHIRIHTGERPYSCHACGDTFSTRSALTSHAFKHSGTLPYPCTRCQLTFRLKRDLIQHEQGHDDEESRMGRAGLMRLAAERSVPKEQQQVQPGTVPGVPMVNNSQVVQPEQPQAAVQHSLPVPPQPIPVSHTVGRANPPMFHRQQPSSNHAVSPTMVPNLQNHPHHLLQPSAAHMTQHSQVHAQVHSQTLPQALVPGVTHMQPIPPHHQPVHPANLQTHLSPQLQAHTQLNVLYQNQL